MYITSVFAASIVVTHYYGAYFALLLAVAASYFLLFSKQFKNSSTVVLLLVLSMVSGVVCFSSHNAESSVFRDKIGENMDASLTVTQIETATSTGMDGTPFEYFRMEAKINEINGNKVNTSEKVLIKYYGEKDILPGNCIKVKGMINEPSARKNPGCFDYAMYLRSLSIKYIIITENIEPCKDSECLSGLEQYITKFYRALHSYKDKCISEIKTYVGEETAGMMQAILFGDTASVEEDVLEEFRRNGTAHILAVSGLHVGIIYGFLCAIWRQKKGGGFFVVVILFFLAYMVMASFSPSVIRAVIMVWIHIFAELTNRRYDMASAAFFTALLMLLHNPMHIFNVGFQMSFLAVLTLSLILPIIKRFYSGIFVASFAVQLGLTPYTIYVFNYISLAALVVNVPIIFLVGIIVPMGMCSMVFMSVFEQLGIMSAKALGGLCMILEKLNSVTCIEGITVFDAKSPSIWIIAMYYLILLVFISEDGRLMIMRRKKKLITVMAVIVVSISLLFSLAAGNHFKKSDIVFVDVGQGDCIHIRTDKNIFGRNSNYLIDGGGSVSYEVGRETLRPYLLKNGAKKIDGAFVTHLHTDHYKGIAELCREGMIDRLYVFEGYSVREEELIKDTGLMKSQITYLCAGQKVVLSEDAYIEILWPEDAGTREYERMAEDETDENSLCLIMKITVKDKSVLVTGDVDSECLDTLAKKYGEALDIDILKAAHHGSRYSDSKLLADAAVPEYVVFQVGKNNFGHPNEGVIENFRQKGIMIYRNDQDGAVAFDFIKNGQIRARTVKGE